MITMETWKKLEAAALETASGRQDLMYPVLTGWMRSLLSEEDAEFLLRVSERTE